MDCVVFASKITILEKKPPPFYIQLFNSMEDFIAENFDLNDT